jgi:hypothetical protein
MALVKGIYNINTRKRKQKRDVGWKQTQEAHEAYLHKLGVRGKSEDVRYALPDLKCDRNQTSDSIPENGSAKSTKRYTGTEISGVVQLHKSSAEPVRRDNPQAAIHAAQMRRN